MLTRSIVACLLLLLTSSRSTTVAAQGKGLPPFLFTAAKSFEFMAWLHGAERFRSGSAVFLSEGKSQRALVPDFAQSADPAVSFDGQRVLVAAKAHAGDHWQIYQVPLGGGAAQRITSGNEDCVRPFYLPGDRLVYARSIDGRFVIEAMDLAGGKALALTHTPANTFPTDVLRDGRILFEAGFPLGTDTKPEIYTVYPDGSGVESYRCDHGASRHSARQTRSGDLIFSSPQTTLARFTSALGRQVSLAAPSGEFSGDFAEIAPSDWLTSWRLNATESFQLMNWKQGAEKLQPVLAEPAMNVVQPVLLAERVAPNRHPSGLHDWSYANLLCLNAYTSKYELAPNSINTVKLYTRDGAGTRLLGTAPVERDGSFFVQVPGDVPLQIELLDAYGKTLKREAGFFWARRGEQRGCVGCHAGPEVSPENKVPMILLKSTTPADMTGTAEPSGSGGH